MKLLLDSNLLTKLCHPAKDKNRPLAEWLEKILEIEAEAWEREIEEDAEAGRLNFLAEEALREYKAGKTREL
jgi:hypothetical protein